MFDLLRRTVPYGMSSYRGPQRVRRAAADKATARQEEETQRCICSTPDTDTECRAFCHSRSVWLFLKKKQKN